MNRRAILFLGLFLASCAGDLPPREPQGPLHEFRRSSGEARIEIWPEERSKWRVPRALYGKFTEHLGWNVYNGMWAQVLRNPGFESWELFGHKAGHMDHVAARLGFKDAFPDLKLSTGPESGIAPWWGPVGEGTFALDAPAFNSGHCQIFEGRDVGVQQPVCLPLHRVGSFELSFWARGSGSLRLSVHSAEKKLLTMGLGNLKEAWSLHERTLNLKQAAVRKGDPLLFRIELVGLGKARLDQMALFPSDHVDGFDPDVIRMLRETKVPLIRWPGGNFVSGYHWKDGIGPVEKRPTRTNPAWKGFEYNHVGTDEFMKFCKAVGCEPMICVNAGDGAPREAAEWVEYCNGSADTKFGALRAENGHPEPYNVRYWEIGNELYGSWQVGHCSPDEYSRRYRRFHDAMRAVDPEILFIANGHDPAWNAPLVKNCADILRCASIHFLPGMGTPKDAPPSEVHEEFAAFPVGVRRYLHHLARQMRQGGVKDPRIAITELQTFTQHRELPTNDTVTDAIFTAGMIHMAIREEGLVEMITHSALVNHGGGLRKQREIVYATPVHYVHELYGRVCGDIPVRTRTTSPTYDCAGKYVGHSKGKDVPVLDAVALIDRGNHVTLIVINRSAEKVVSAAIDLHDFPCGREVLIRTLTGPGFMARNTWEEPGAARLIEGRAEMTADGLPFEFPPHSVTALIFRR